MSSGSASPETRCSPSPARCSGEFLVPAASSESLLCATPDGVMFVALSFLESDDVVVAAAACRFVLRTAKCPALWSCLCLSAFGRRGAGGATLPPLAAAWDPSGASLDAAMRSRPEFDETRPLHADLWATTAAAWPRTVTTATPRRALKDAPTVESAGQGVFVIRYQRHLNGSGYDVCAGERPSSIRCPVCRILPGNTATARDLDFQSG